MRLAPLIALLLGSSASFATAASLTLTLGPVAAYDDILLMNHVPGFSPDHAIAGVLYEIPVSFQLFDLAPGQSFGNVAFNVSYDGALAPDPYLNPVDGMSPYLPSDQRYMTLPFHTSFPYYFINNDAGPNTDDLQAIVAAFPAGAATPQRAAAGVASPFLLGKLYFDLASTTVISHLKITGVQWSLNDNGTLITQPAGSVGPLPGYTIGTAFVPVPTPTAATAGVTLLTALLSFRPRRQAH